MEIHTSGKIWYSIGPRLVCIIHHKWHNACLHVQCSWDWESLVPWIAKLKTCTTSENNIFTAEDYTQNCSVNIHTNLLFSVTQKIIIMNDDHHMWCPMSKPDASVHMMEISLYVVII